MAFSIYGPLGERSIKVLAVIQEYINKYGDAPTTRELLVLSGLKSTSNVAHHITRLEERGLITFRRIGPRQQARLTSTRLTESGRRELRQRSGM